jgi:hypothetical protein
MLLRALATVLKLFIYFLASAPYFLPRCINFTWISLPK